MDCMPKIPEDIELRNIIDKLANFVARNGPEFEQMTKQKQKDNPKFSFLFSGEHFNYYQYRVTTEQAIQKQQQQKLAQQQAMVQQVITQQSIRTAPWQQQQQSQQLLQEQLEQQRKSAAEQIKQSETNLAAQYDSILQQQQIAIDQGIVLAKKEQLMLLGSETGLSLDELASVVQPIIDSCTKDAISNGKNWIFTHHLSQKHGDFVALYLLDRVADKDAPFECRLHLIYLINDVLHHCMRKNADDLKCSIEAVVVPIVCISQLGVDDERRTKIAKQMKDPLIGMSIYQASLISRHADTVQRISAEMNARYLSLQKQHQDFVGHLHAQIAALEQQLIAQSGGTSMPGVMGILGSADGSAGFIPSSGHMMPGHPMGDQIPLPQQPQPMLGRGNPPAQQMNLGAITGSGPAHPVGMGSAGTQMPHGGPNQVSFGPPGFGAPPPNYNQPPPGFTGPGGLPPQIMNEFGGMQSAGPQAPNIHLPDFSKPPPGFPPTGPGFPPSGPGFPILPALPPHLLHPPPAEPDLMPSMPYYDLPAGLMAPLVKLEDCEYRPLDPKDIRLPPPMPPTERLLAAVEAFYSAPSHERPRDSEGWEKLGLFEFFKAKQRAKKQNTENGRGHKKRSESPLRRGRVSTRRSKSKSPAYQRSSKSKSKSKSRSHSRSSSSSSSSTSSSSGSRSRSDSRSRSQSRKSSPEGGKSAQRRSPSRKSPPSGSRRSPTSSRKSSPRKSSPSTTRSSRRSREKSSTPPGFSYSEPFYQVQSENSRLGEDNKGHQLLTKMGWGGRGLGTAEQGIVDPVAHADVRDRQDMFKGIGIQMNDPFEQFRKNRSHGYTTRMKEKAEAALEKAAAAAVKSPSPSPPHID